MYMNGKNHDGDHGEQRKRPEEQEQSGEQEQPKQQRELWRQCGWCMVRMSGPLAGWKADRLLPDYTHWICAACQAEWEASSDEGRRAWARERAKRDRKGKSKHDG